jgi:hypothetical protein
MSAPAASGGFVVIGISPARLEAARLRAEQRGARWDPAGSRDCRSGTW